MSIRFSFKNHAGHTVFVEQPDRAGIGKTINILRKGSRNFDAIMRKGGR